MSYSPPSSAFRVSLAPPGPAPIVRLCLGVGLLSLGTALFALGIFHGFEHGSCSTTGYSSNYGPIQRCASGVGWWMLMLMVGLGVAGLGAVLWNRVIKLVSPALFLGIGAPFLALALTSGNIQLLQNASASTGKLFAGIFGACFLIAGGAWGAIAGWNAFSRLSLGSLLGGLLAAAVGVALALAFAIAAWVMGAIGTSAPPATQPGSRGGGAVHPRGNNPAITAAQNQARIVKKLAACVLAAGADQAKIQQCEAKYKP